MSFLSDFRKAHAKKRLLHADEDLARHLQKINDGVLLLQTDLSKVDVPEGEQVFRRELEQFVLNLHALHDFARHIKHWSGRLEMPEATAYYAKLVDDTAVLLKQATSQLQKPIDKQQAGQLVQLGSQLVRHPRIRIELSETDQELEKIFKQYDYSKELRELLRQHPADLKILAKKAGTNAHNLFWLGIPALAKEGLLTKENGLMLVELGKSAGTNAHNLFWLGIPALAKEGLLTKENGLMLVELGKSAGTNAHNLFR